MEQTVQAGLVCSAPEAAFASCSGIVWRESTLQAGSDDHKLGVWLLSTLICSLVSTGPAPAFIRVLSLAVL
jgi:hypothetical protein